MDPLASQSAGTPDLSAVEARALHAIARKRIVGLHFFGHFLRIERAAEAAPDGGVVMRLVGDRGEGPATLVELATATDMVLGQSIRDQLPPRVRLATRTLDLHLSGEEVGPPVEVHGRVQWIDPSRGTATATCELRDGAGRVVGSGAGGFSAPPAPRGMRPRPVDWAALAGGVPELRRDDLEPDERAALAAVEQLAARGGGTAVTAATIERLLAVDWAPGDGPSRRGALEVGPHLENRVGHLQGGAVLALGAMAAREVAGGDHVVVDAHVQYLRPVPRGMVEVEATLLRAGRTTSFARVVILAEGRVCAEVSVTLTAR